MAIATISSLNSQTRQGVSGRPAETLSAPGGKEQDCAGQGNQNGPTVCQRHHENCPKKNRITSSMRAEARPPSGCSANKTRPQSPFRPGVGSIAIAKTRAQRPARGISTNAAGTRAAPVEASAHIFRAGPRRWLSRPSPRPAVAHDLQLLLSRRLLKDRRQCRPGRRYAENPICGQHDDCNQATTA